MHRFLRLCVYIRVLFTCVRVHACITHAHTRTNDSVGIKHAKLLFYSRYHRENEDEIIKQAKCCMTRVYYA